MLAPLTGTAAGRRGLTVGAGGDLSLELDLQAERAAIEILEEVASGGERFSLLSEEIGLRDYGAAYPLVVLDPVDGSLNAKHGIPFFATMLALLEGPLLRDLRAGHVRNLVTRSSWDAVKDAGALRDGKPLRPLASGGPLELLALESSPSAMQAAGPLIASAGKVRVLGCMALALAHTAAGEIDIFCAPIRARLFDMAACLLLLSESGGVASDMEGADVGGLPLNLETRSTILVSSDPDVHEALRLLRAGVAL